MMIDSGMRSSGGFSDQLSHISYKENSDYFFGKFAYGVLFYIVIILILGNIFLGIIVDSFAELRDRNNQKDIDKRSVCFICQLSKDESMNQKIDFKQHTLVDHKMWNYVYFLTYLHVSNPNDFNYLQDFVWDSLPGKDPSWIPVVNGKTG